MKRYIIYTSYCLAFFTPAFINISSNRFDNLLAQISATFIIYLITKIIFYKDARKITINIYVILYLVILLFFSMYMAYKFKPYFPINLFTVMSIIFIGISILEYYFYINSKKE